MLKEMKDFVLKVSASATSQQMTSYSSLKILVIVPLDRGHAMAGAKTRSEVNREVVEHSCYSCERESHDVAANR